MKYPWVPVILDLAEAWGVPPWEIDLADPVKREWVRRVLRVGALKAEAKKWRKEHGLD